MEISHEARQEEPAIVHSLTTLLPVFGGVVGGRAREPEHRDSGRNP